MELIDTCALCRRLLWKKQLFCATCIEDFFCFDLIHRNIQGLDVYSLFYYSPPADSFIVALKGGKLPSLASLLSSFAVQKLILKTVHSFDIVMPVPAKVFGASDHAFILAENVAANLNASFSNRMVRRGHAEDIEQKEKSITEREGVHFKLVEHPRMIENKSLLIVDDVVTTGATIVSMWKALGKPNAAAALTLGTTPRFKDLTFWP